MILLFTSVAMIAVSFWAGMKTADRYHREAMQHEEYSLRLAHARMESGSYSSYVAPIQPIGQPFMDRLKSQGKATQQIRKSKQA